jgi:hypothetical protein
MMVWPTVRVKKAELMPSIEKNCSSAMPVMIDGKISGDIKKVLSRSRPGKR